MLKKNEDFFQGCGLYVVGSSLKNNQKFNDIDIVLVGLDFRAIVAYSKIFIMDPETLIAKNVLVEPRLFSVLKKSPEITKPVTQCTDEEGGNHWEAHGRRGLKYNGVVYDYNIEECLWCPFGSALTLTNYCNNDESITPLIDNLQKVFSSNSEEYYSIEESPFNHYAYNRKGEAFLVYHFLIEDDANLPAVEWSEENIIKPIDFCIHTENLYQEEWKKYQKSLGLSFLTLKEWPERTKIRKIITNLDYPDFIDPAGKKRATSNHQRMISYRPDLTELIEQH